MGRKRTSASTEVIDLTGDDTTIMRSKPQSNKVTKRSRSRTITTIVLPKDIPVAEALPKLLKRGRPPKQKKTEPSPKRRAKKATVKAEVLATEEEQYLLPELRGRLERARGQKMFIVERNFVNNSRQTFDMLGSTGNLYTIDISHKIKCNCRDFIYRRNHCKHILMVLLKVFHLPAASPAFRSLNLSPELLQDMFSKAMPDPGVLVDEHIQKAIKAKLYHVEPSDGGSVQRRPLDTSDCPICFEEFEEKQLAKILFCKTCGNNVHEVCFVAWKKSRGSQVTCVYCRSEWPSDVKKGKKKPKSSDLNEEGYVNFAAAAGLSSKRDSTTYRLYPGAPNSWTYR